MKIKGVNGEVYIGGVSVSDAIQYKNRRQYEKRIKRNLASNDLKFVVELPDGKLGFGEAKGYLYSLLIAEKLGRKGVYIVVESHEDKWLYIRIDHGEIDQDVEFDDLYGLIEKFRSDQAFYDSPEGIYLNVDFEDPLTGTPLREAFEQYPYEINTEGFAANIKPNESYLFEEIESYISRKASERSRKTIAFSAVAMLGVAAVAMFMLIPEKKEDTGPIIIDEYSEYRNSIPNINPENVFNLGYLYFSHIQSFGSAKVTSCKYEGKIFSCSLPMHSENNLISISDFRSYVSMFSMEAKLADSNVLVLSRPILGDGDYSSVITNLSDLEVYIVDAISNLFKNRSMTSIGVATSKGQPWGTKKITVAIKNGNLSDLVGLGNILSSLPINVKNININFSDNEIDITSEIVIFGEH